MKKLHTLGLGSMVIAAVTGILVACSGDDTVVTNNDAGTDSSTPIPTSTVTAQDSGPPGDANVADVVPLDATLEAASYGETVGETLCNALTKCCFNNPNVVQGGTVDGGTFNRSVCAALYDKLGFENSNLGLQVTHDNVAVDPVKGADCLAKLANLSCNLTSAELKAAREACFDALVGQLKAGDACLTSLQCPKDTFCLKVDGGTPADGGGLAGTCVALRGQGHACGDVQVTGTDPASTEEANDSYAAEEACSWRGGGDTNLACASVDLVTGEYKASRSEWTCEVPAGDGGFCNTSVSCADGICDTDNGFVCVPILQYFNANACTFARQ